jgi:tetratricopeptide (TPR) repeat protein
VRDLASAKLAFAEALVRSPENLDCLLNLCVCELMSKDAISAEAYARRALKRSVSASAWANLGFALLMQERLPEAGEAFAKSEHLAWTSSDEDKDDLNQGTVFALAWTNPRSNCLLRRGANRPTPA